MLEKTRRVRMTVFQPRINNVDTWEISVERLEEWRETVARPAAKNGTLERGYRVFTERERV